MSKLPKIIIKITTDGQNPFNLTKTSTIKILRIILSIVKEGDKTIYRNIKKKKEIK